MASVATIIAFLFGRQPIQQCLAAYFHCGLLAAAVLILAWAYRRFH